MGLPERLMTARELSGISARRLDELASLAPGHTRLIETGLRPRVEARTAAALCRVLGVSIDWLITGAGDPPKEDAVKAAVSAALQARTGTEG